MQDESLRSIKGVGESVLQKLNILGIYTAADLLHFYPRKYEDYSVISEISRIKPGPSTIQAEIKQITGRYVRRGMHITEAIASDSSGSVRLVWFNQPYRANVTQKNTSYFISGNFEMTRGRLSFMNPSMELVKDFPLSTARIVPVYRETKGLKSAAIRKIIANAQDYVWDLDEILPSTVLKKSNLLLRNQAIFNMHFPESQLKLHQAKERLGFEEIFCLSLASLINKREASKEKTHVIPFDVKLAKTFVSKLPFQLTNSQKKVVWQIYNDLQREMPMNRLIEGDVGSGKTVVAAMAAIMVINKGYQVAFMAPTELLARQHADTIHKLMNLIERKDDVVLLTGSLKPSQKKLVHNQIKNGQYNFIVGTHALITDAVAMKNLGLVVVDEQHRFGVEQRRQLQKKAGGKMPHVLSMTATPIPRTLALTLYGELDISVLEEKPPGRLPIITKICSPNSRDQLYLRLNSEIDKNRQVFVVCPLIAESDKLQVLSAEKVYDNLSKGAFKHRNVGLLHGKMSADDKKLVMEKFIAHKLDILVSTTVVEVGVDVPNASIMLIEAAERFGLAQIHQLRGRVGRNMEQGYCYLMLSDSKEPSRRIRALETTSDGFKLSELDLEIRGPGAIYGQYQSGKLDLRVAKLSDTKLIESAREAAKELLESCENLENFPKLMAVVSRNRSITNLN